MDWAAFWAVVKQYGPLVGILGALVYFLAHQIEKLLDRNAAVYENHIKQLWETQNRLLSSVLGPQPSSTPMPTVDQLKEAAKKSNGAPEQAKSAQASGGK